MPRMQGGVFRIKGSELSELAEHQNINVVVVSSEALHALDSVWFFPIVAEPGTGRVRIEDAKKANVAENSYVDCTNLVAKSALVLRDSPHVGAQAIGHLSWRDWRHVRRALDRYIKG